MMDRASEQRYFLRVARYRAGGAITPRASRNQFSAFTAKNSVSAARNVWWPVPKMPFRLPLKGSNGIRPIASIAGPVPAYVLRKQWNLSARPCRLMKLWPKLPKTPCFMMSPVEALPYPVASR